MTAQSLPQIDLNVAGPDGPATLAVGATAPSFSDLLGVDGKRHSLADYDASPLLVLIFSSNRCPTAKAYTERLNRLHADYGPRGVQLVLINSNSPYLYGEESYERMVSLAHELGYTFPYLQDETQNVARAYGPTRTFHVFLLDSERLLRYEGRLDDARVPANVTTSDLANALNDLLADQPVRVPHTKAFGCSLDIV